MTKTIADVLIEAKGMSPEAKTKTALTITLDRALDVSGRDRIAIADAKGRRVKGKASFGAGETSWRFTPDALWAVGDYELRIHPSLEDVAGNRTCAPFEGAGVKAVECGDVAVEFRVE